MITYLLILIIGLQLADIATTCLCIKRGKGVEANGILAKLFARIGLLPGLLLVKGSFIVLLLWVAPGMPEPWAQASLFCAALLYIWVCFNNLRVLRG